MGKNRKVSTTIRIFQKTWRNSINFFQNPKTFPVILACASLIAGVFLWYAAYHSRYHAINYVHGLRAESEADGNLGVPIRVFIATPRNEDAAERWVSGEDQHSTPHVCLNSSNTRISSTFTFKVDNESLTLEELHTIARVLFPSNPLDITV